MTALPPFKDYAEEPQEPAAAATLRWLEAHECEIKAVVGRAA